MPIPKLNKNDRVKLTQSLNDINGKHVQSGATGTIKEVLKNQYSVNLVRFDLGGMAYVLPALLEKI